jgi:hypothetical protein
VYGEPVEVGVGVRVGVRVREFVDDDDGTDVVLRVVVALLVALHVAVREALAPFERVFVGIAVRDLVSVGVLDRVAELEAVAVRVGGLDGETVSEADAGVATRHTRRTRWLFESAMTRLPLPSSATAVGTFSDAKSASPPSFENPWRPSPATVSIDASPAETRRTTKLPESAMNTLPAESTVSPAGLLRRAEVAGPPSPLRPSVIAVPANVDIRPPTTARTTFRVGSEINRRPLASTARPCGLTSAADVAGHESPRRPPPATVDIKPDAHTARMRLFSLSAT